MIELPQEFRDLLEEKLDEYLDTTDNTGGAASMVRDIVEHLQKVGEECEIEVPNGDMIAYIETEGDLDDGLFDLLLEELEEEDLEDFTGDDLLTVMEKLVEIEWADGDEESLGVEELDEDLGFNDAVIDELDDDF